MFLFDNVRMLSVSVKGGIGKDSGPIYFHADADDLLYRLHSELDKYDIEKKLQCWLSFLNIIRFKWFLLKRFVSIFMMNDRVKRREINCLDEGLFKKTKDN